MLFHTPVFAIFFAIVILLFLVMRSWPRKIMLLAASWVFYGWLDWRFLALIIGSSAADFLLGLAVERFDEPHKRKMALGFSMFVNLAFLSIFKYYDFFVTNLHDLLAALGVEVSFTILHLALPVGISFYTFQSMSYVFDVYRRDIKATRNFFDYALFVAFFPHLVAGPIQRAAHLLPQLAVLKGTSRQEVADGVLIFTVGLLYKVFMADNLAPLVDMVFAAPAADGLAVILATYCFGFQIYGDFAGYSLMAIGTARILGVDLTDNFRMPYFSHGAVEFWRRWHISLSSWFRDYLYIPLGGNRVIEERKFFNWMFVMLVCGLWHGAGWTFVAWGGFHGLLISLDHVLMKSRFSLHPVLRWAIWIHPIFMGWLLFRAQDIHQVGTMLGAVLQDFRLSSPFGAASFLGALALYALPVMAMEGVLILKGRKYWFEGLPPMARLAGFIAMVLICLTLGKFDSKAFIYFAF